MKYYTIKIHNNSISHIKEGKDEDAAFEFGMQLFQEQCNRPMTGDEEEEFKDNWELITSGDGEEKYTYTIAKL